VEIHIVALGAKLPDWMEVAVTNYAKRIQGLFRLKVTEIPIPKRSKSQALQKAIKIEGDRMLAAIHDDAFVVALDVKGKSISTLDLVNQIEKIKQSHPKLCFLIGGPDGLHQSCLQRANTSWSLSNMTLPHGLARIMLVEQLYRAQSIQTGHPYHRE